MPRLREACGPVSAKKLPGYPGSVRRESRFTISFMSSRAIMSATLREVLAEIAAESLLASASPESVHPVPPVPAETAAPRKARASTKAESSTQAKPTFAASIKTRARAAGR